MVATREAALADLDPQRVLVLGPAGSGKSTTARRLGDRLDLPVVHLDVHFWKPGWEMPPREAWVETQRELVDASDRWVIDGNYTSTLEVRLPAADTVVLLEVSRWRRIVRILRRWLRYRGRSRPDLADGCPEKVDPEFLRYAWNFENTTLRVIERKLGEYGQDVTVVRIDSSSADALEWFLDRVDR